MEEKISEKISTEKISTEKISKESAEIQINLLLDYYDLEEEDLGDDQQVAFKNSISKLTKAVQKGRLEIIEDDSLKIIQHLKKPPGEITEITYRELDGKSRVAMKNKSETDLHGRLYSMMGSLSGLGETAMVGLKGVDLSIVECLGMVFLLV